MFQIWLFPYIVCYILQALLFPVDCIRLNILGKKISLVMLYTSYCFTPKNISDCPITTEFRRNHLVKLVSTRFLHYKVFFFPLLMVSRCNFLVLCQYPIPQYLFYFQVIFYVVFVVYQLQSFCNVHYLGCESSEAKSPHSCPPVLRSWA